jgi:peptidoglycan/xylan/chitin deacetylase (PgdA/CDA1 family)
MRIPGAKTAAFALRRLVYRFAPRGLILHYHRVAELPTDPYLLCVSPRRFAEQIEVAARYARVVSLSQLVRMLAEGTLPSRTLAVTFDDGYADNLLQAQPILERYAVPATFFVATGYIGQAREFWWDELDRLILQPGTLPGTLSLRIGEREFCYQLGAAARYSDADFQRARGWTIDRPAEPGSRQQLFLELWTSMHALAGADRQCVLDQVLQWAGAERSARATHRTLSAEEVARLGKSDLAEIGAHTVTHPALARLTLAAQRDEIARSKADLEALVERPIASFSYPHGLRSDYTPETVAAVQAAGFGCACTSLAAAVRAGEDRFQLPRNLVRDWDGEAFARHLWGFFRG